MANRIVTAAVSGESIRLSSKNAGAAGSFNAVSLAFTFDSAWDGTTSKIVQFLDAYGANPVNITLTDDLLVDGKYIVDIPAKPLVYAGEMNVTIRGVQISGETTERIIMSATTTMKVLNSLYETSGGSAPIEPTPSQAEQLLAAVSSVTGMTATATTLSAGSSATVTKTTNADNTINLGFGIPKGDAATITIGEVRTGESGTIATVENVGDANKAIFDFSIPRGFDGSGRGLLPQITVTAPNGSYVTAVCGDVTLTATVTSETVNFDVPSYGTWSITATLSADSATGSVVVDTVKKYALTLGYYKIYGFTINEAESNPATSVTYTDGATAFTKGSSAWDTSPLFNDIKPCLFKSGAVVGYLQRNDYTKFENGTAADITSGNTGDVMVEIPKMAYYMEKSGNIITCKVFVGAIDAKTIDSRYSYLPFSRTSEGDRAKIYVGAYLGYNLSSKLRSLSNKAPTASTTIGAFRTLAQANGTGYQQLPFYQLTLLQILYIMKYGSLDSQTALGRGYVDENTNAINTGGANSKGFCYGEATGKLQMKMFGIEDFYGNLYQWIDGLYCNASWAILTTYKSFNDTGSGYLFNNSSGLSVNTGGYMNQSQGTTQAGFNLKAGSGSSSTYYAVNAFLNGGYLPFFGGDWSNASDAGAFRLSVNCPASYANANIGARLCYI